MISPESEYCSSQDDISEVSSCAMLQVRTILLSIQSLLGEPNNDSPLNTHAAELWSNQVSLLELQQQQQVLIVIFSGGIQEVFVRKVRKRYQIRLKTAGSRKNFSLLITFCSFVTTDFCIMFFLTND